MSKIVFFCLALFASVVLVANGEMHPTDWVPGYSDEAFLATSHPDWVGMAYRMNMTYEQCSDWCNHEEDCSWFVWRVHVEQGNKYQSTHGCLLKSYAQVENAYLISLPGDLGDIPSNDPRRHWCNMEMDRACQAGLVCKQCDREPVCVWKSDVFKGGVKDRDYVKCKHYSTTPIPTTKKSTITSSTTTTKTTTSTTTTTKTTTSTTTTTKTTTSTTTTTTTTTSTTTTATTSSTTTATHTSTTAEPIKSTSSTTTTATTTASTTSSKPSTTKKATTTSSTTRETTTSQFMSSTTTTGHATSTTSAAAGGGGMNGTVIAIGAAGASAFVAATAFGANKFLSKTSATPIDGNFDNNVEAPHQSVELEQHVQVNPAMYA